MPHSSPASGGAGIVVVEEEEEEEEACLWRHARNIQNQLWRKGSGDSHFTGKIDIG